jgi:Tfp pilus assembly protein PilX
MRVVLILIVLLLVALFIGWISFSRGPERSSINLETTTIRQDTKKAVQSGEALLHKTEEKLDAAQMPQKQQVPAVENRPAPVVK